MNEHEEWDTAMTGVDPRRLDDQQLMKELENIHRTRHDTLLHASSDALRAHNGRMAELEGEYLRRNPQRPVAAGRTRAGPGNGAADPPRHPTSDLSAGEARAEAGAGPGHRRRPGPSGAA